MGRQISGGSRINAENLRSLDSMSMSELMRHHDIGSTPSFKAVVDRNLRGFREQVERHIDISLRELGRTIVKEHEMAMQRSTGHIMESQLSEDQPILGHFDSGQIHSMLSPPVSIPHSRRNSPPRSRPPSKPVSRQVSRESSPNGGVRRGIPISGPSGGLMSRQATADNMFLTAPAMPEHWVCKKPSGGACPTNHSGNIKTVLNEMSRFRVSSAPIMTFERKQPVNSMGSRQGTSSINSLDEWVEGRSKAIMKTHESHTEVEHEDGSSRSSAAAEDAVEESPKNSPSTKRIQFGGIEPQEYTDHDYDDGDKTGRLQSSTSRGRITLERKKSSLKRRSDSAGSFGAQSEGMVSHKSMFGRGSTGATADQSLQPLPVWRTERYRISAASSHHQNEEKGIWADEDKEEEEATAAAEKDKRNKCLQRVEAYVIPPNSAWRLMWELLGCLFILYDVAVIPLQMFDVSGNEVMQWGTRIFWTLDLPCTLMTGIMLGDGSITCDLKSIVTRYARTWLALDIVVVSVDWVEVFMSQSGESSVGAARVGKTVRVLRMLRLLRLLRMAKLPMIAGTILESLIRSERVLLIASMVKLMCFIATLMHFIACIWWGIGRLGDGASWVVEAQLDEAAFGYQYATSFHWSMTQFTGTMEVFPVNLPERVFSVVVLLFAFVVSAAFISTFTSSMTRLQMLSGAKNEMFHALRRYLSDHDISRRLTQRISRNAHHAYHEFERTLPESDIQLLKLVSEPLRVELHYELYKPVLTNNPFMRTFCEEIPPAVRRICHTAVSTSFFASGDVVFISGEQPQEPVMYFVLRGSLTYRRERRDFETVKLQAEKGDWLSEPALWCEWTHCGALRADTESQLLLLDSHQFGIIAPQIQAASNWEVRLYALAYVELLNEQLFQGNLSDMDEEQVSTRAGARAFEELNMGNSASLKSASSNQDSGLLNVRGLVGRASAWVGRGSGLFEAGRTSGRLSGFRTSIVGGIRTSRTSGIASNTGLSPITPQVREEEEGSESGGECEPIESDAVVNCRTELSTSSFFGTSARSPTSRTNCAPPGLVETTEPDKPATSEEPNQTTRDGSTPE